MPLDIITTSEPLVTLNAHNTLLNQLAEQLNSPKNTDLATCDMCFDCSEQVPLQRSLSVMEG